MALIYILVGSFGQLGLGTGITPKCVTVPTAIEFFDVYPILDVYAGENHSLALGESGRLWVFGCNKHGQVEITLFQSHPDSWVLALLVVCEQFRLCWIH